MSIRFARLKDWWHGTNKTPEEFLMWTMITDRSASVLQGAFIDSREFYLQYNGIMFGQLTPDRSDELVIRREGRQVQIWRRVCQR